jgi:hypothetical protein
MDPDELMKKRKKKEVQDEIQHMAGQHFDIGMHRYGL